MFILPDPVIFYYVFLYGLGGFGAELLCNKKAV